MFGGFSFRGFLGNGRSTVLRGLFRTSKLSEFCAKLGEFAVAHTHNKTKGTHRALTLRDPKNSLRLVLETPSLGTVFGPSPTFVSRTKSGQQPSLNREPIAPRPFFQELRAAEYFSVKIVATGLTCWGAALVKTGTGNTFSEDTRELPESIASASANVGELSDFKYCTANFSGSALCRMQRKRFPAKCLN